MRGGFRVIPSPTFMSARRLAALALVLAACAQKPESDAQAQPQPEGAPAAEPGKDWGSLFGRGKEPEWKFDFKDPPAGERAPVTRAFHLELGQAKFPDAEALTRRLGLVCGDTSIRAMMDARRVAERKRIEEAKARGEDAVTAASWLNRKSKREANPQIRYSCVKTDSAALGDRVRPPTQGRLLFVFDSADYPLRHASYQRTGKDTRAAILDFDDAVAYYTGVYGPAHKTPDRELPRPDDRGVVELPPATNYEYEWNYADLTVRVGILRFNDMITVGERIEVPHGIRPDAPRLGKSTPDAAITPPAAPSTPPPAAPSTPPPAAPAAPAQPAAPAK
jgi:hypothetical protein